MQNVPLWELCLSFRWFISNFHHFQIEKYIMSQNECFLKLKTVIDEDKL
jgi:hypothetical protein